MKHVISAVIALLVVGSAGYYYSYAKEDGQKFLPNSVVIGDIRFTGSAESGQYASHLFNLKQFIAENLVNRSNLRVFEDDRMQEAVDELNIEQILNESPVIVGAGSTSVDPDTVGISIQGNSGDIKIDLNNPEPQPFTDSLAKKLKIPSAEYLMVGEMNGFDLDIYRGPSFAQTSSGIKAGGLTGKKWVMSTSVSLRLFNLKSRVIEASKRLEIEELIEDANTAEQRVNKALNQLAGILVSEVLLARAGGVRVASVQGDKVQLDHGRNAGLEPGMYFQPASGDGAIIVDEADDTKANASFVGQAVKLSKGMRLNLASKMSVMTGGFNATAKQAIRLSLSPFAWDKSVCRVPSGVTCSYTDNFHSYLEAELNQIPGLDVVDLSAEKTDDALAHQMLNALSEGREPGLPMGSIRGVDYIVTGKVTSVKFKTSDKSSNPQSMTDIFASTAKGKIEAIVYVQDINTADYAVSKPITMEYDTDLPVSAKKAYNAFMQSFYDRIIQEIATNTRPVEVLVVNGSSVVINAGKEAGLKIGDLFAAKSAGTSVKDDYTGVVFHGIGSEELARVEVTGFADNGLATATIVSGNIPAPGVRLKPVSKDTARAPSGRSQPFDGEQAEPTMKINW